MLARYGGGTYQCVGPSACEAAATRGWVLGGGGGGTGMMEMGIAGRELKYTCIHFPPYMYMFTNTNKFADVYLYG